jgi:hypothetical protein
MSKPQCEYIGLGKRCILQAEFELRRKSGDKVRYCEMHAQQLRSLQLVVSEVRLPAANRVVCRI